MNYQKSYSIQNVLNLRLLLKWNRNLMLKILNKFKKMKKMNSTRF